MEEGEEIPDFKLTTHEGETITKDDLAGQPFVLFAYPRALTSGCTKEVCSVRDHYIELKERGIRPLGISDDPPEKNKKFAEKHDLQYDLLSDEDGELLKALGSYGEKKMYGKTFEGTFRHSFIIDSDGKIQKIIKKVNTSEHGQQLLDAIEDLDL